MLLCSGLTGQHSEPFLSQELEGILPRLDIVGAEPFKLHRLIDLLYNRPDLRLVRKHKPAMCWILSMVRSTHIVLFFSFVTSWFQSSSFSAAALASSSAFFLSSYFCFFSKSLCRFFAPLKTPPVLASHAAHVGSFRYRFRAHDSQK